MAATRSGQHCGPVRAVVLAGCLAFGLAGLSGCGGGEDASPRAPLAQAAAKPSILGLDPEIASFYERRGFRPLWLENGSLRPEAFQLLRLLRSVHRDGLDPDRYLRPDLVATIGPATAGGSQVPAEAEFLLSRAFAAFVHDLRAPRGVEEMIFVDQELAPKPSSTGAILTAAAEAPSLAAHLASVQRMNPVYEGLRTALAKHHATGGSESEARIIEANLERARMIPADPGDRFVLVDAAGARLWLYENGRVVDTMRVIVGKQRMQTPAMAGFIRFAVFNPYWNIPHDLVRDSIAPRVLRHGLSVLQDERLEPLSDFTTAAVAIDPVSIDWDAVAAGQVRQKLRQLPGAANMMGDVKFMFPNRLGIYLHDTPDKGAFRLADRRRSSGCVRVEDADRLAAWLFRGEVTAAGASPEERRDLPTPVPVYITYLTAIPGPQGILFQRDVYGRDKALIAWLQRPSPAASYASQALRSHSKMVRTTVTPSG